MTVSLEQRVASIEKLLSLMRPFLKGPMHGMSMFENLAERSTDPEDPPEGFGSLWLSDGTGSGDDGDLIFERTAGAVTAASILNIANSAGQLEADLALLATGDAAGQILTAQGDNSVAWEAPATVILPNTAYTSGGSSGTNSTSYVDATSTVSITTTAASSTILIWTAFSHQASVANYISSVILTDSANTQIGATRTNTGTMYIGMSILGRVTGVAAGTYTYKLRHKINNGFASSNITGEEMTLMAVAE